MSWLLTRGRLPYLCALFAATAWLGALASRVRVETSNASLASSDAEQSEAYTRFKATFGSDEDLLFAVTTPHLLEHEGLALVASLTERVARIAGVRRATSLTNAQELVPGEAGAELVPLVGPSLDGPGVSERARAALDRNPDYTGLLVSADRRSAGILIEIEDRPGDLEYRAGIIAALREIIAAESLGDVSLHVTGIAVQKHDVSEIRKKELANWPDGPGRGDATRSVEALAATRKQLWKELPEDPKADRRQKLWIEFVLAADAAFVAIGRFEMDPAAGPVRVTAREVLVWLDPARGYVRRNMRLIAADSFHVEGDALESLLAPLALLRGAQGAAADGGT